MKIISPRRHPIREKAERIGSVARKFCFDGSNLQTLGGENVDFESEGNLAL